MAETYCGKSCAECAQKESLNCPGCKIGPGRQYGGECELAMCVRSKGHETCDTCSFVGNCGTLRGRERMPDNRRRKAEAEAQRKAAIARRAPVLGKWLWVMFWLVIPSTIADLLTAEFVVESVPALNVPGQILNAITSVAYGLILLKLASQENRYRTAGICTLVAVAFNILVTLFAEGRAWVTLLSLPVAIVSFVGVYNEYMGHSEVLTGVDNELSEKWEKLWKWHIGLFCGMIGCILILLIAPILGAVCLLATAIGVLVVSIVKLVYLYRTAKIFREYPVSV